MVECTSSDLLGPLGPARHRLFWLDEDGKPWAAVVKLTENGEVYLQSYRRASRRNVGKWEER